VPTACPSSLLTSLKDYIASGPVATASNAPTSSPGAVQTDIYCRSNPCDIAHMRAHDPRGLIDIACEIGELEVRVAFRDPFKKPRLEEDIKRTRSCNVSPQTIA
jgi:hypothetical protein